jgi:hypothetical protein
MQVIDQLQASHALPQGKEPPILVTWDTGWIQGPIWTLWGREPPSSSPYHVAIPTELSRITTTIIIIRSNSSSGGGIA